MIEERLKERLVGAAVLTAVAVIFIPMVFEGGSEKHQPMARPEAGFASSILSADHPSPAVDVVAVEPAVAGWVVQLASFSREANAQSLRAKLVARGFGAFIEKTTTTRSSMYRVRVGPTSGRQQAQDLRTALQQAVSLQGVVVRYP